MKVNHAQSSLHREKHGFNIWCERFAFVFIFLILVLSITGEQIRVSTVPNGRAPTADEIEARYLPKWQPAFIVAIVFGILLSLKELWQIILSLELWQIGSSWRKIRYVMDQLFFFIVGYVVVPISLSLLTG